MSFNTYITAVQAEAARGNATEHTFRPALKTFLESLDTGIAATNEPRRIECGAPDYQVTRASLPVGHIEAKDLHVDLDKELRSAQMARYFKALPNLILTNYLEFRWFVNGELRDTARIARRDRGGKGGHVPRRSGTPYAIFAKADKGLILQRTCPFDRTYRTKNAPRRHSSGYNPSYF